MAGRKSKSKHVTILDVARACGFSTSTVSIVLNEAPLSRYVAASTKLLVRKTAEEMGYHPDASARSLRSRRSQTIGVIHFDLSDPFCTLILRGIQEALDPTPYLPVIMDARNERKQFEGYLNMLVQRRVEGVIVVANWLFEDGGLLVDLSKIRVPIVVVGRDLTKNKISSVIVDNEAGGYAAMEHLYTLGHRKIAIIRGPEKLNDSIRRCEGMARFAHEHGFTLEPNAVVELPASLDPASGFAGGIRLTQHLLDSKLEFTAIAAFDDLTALGVIRSLTSSGRRVPEDCSVIGFDDIPSAAFMTPGITTVRQPMEEMGRLGAEYVLRALQTNDTAEPMTTMMQLLAPSLIIRASTSKPDIPK